MYTVEIYRRDRRTKAGERLVEKRDVDGIDAAVSWPLRQGERVAIYQTWVTRVNFLSGRRYQERYDTPRHCSPSNELYWSM
jgi:hypothetical protein